MATMNKLDEISTAIEQVVKILRGDAPIKKRMSLGAFVGFAASQIQAAAKDEPAIAKRRLTALKRNVDEVIAAIAKVSAEDTDSENIEVEVSTAFAPTQADGDIPMPELTTGGDQSSTEVPLTSAGVAASDSGFAENLSQLGKALQKLQVDLGTTSAGGSRDRTSKAAGDRRPDGGARGIRGEGREGGGREGGDRDQDGWPLDMASDTFLKGDAGADVELVWGRDPDGVAAPKKR
jgi:hypothetical protein